MSERFEVPEPSAEAADAYRAKRDIGLASVDVSLRAAYAVDVPAIVRAEVERALEAQYQSDDQDFDISAYLVARFGGAL